MLSMPPPRYHFRKWPRSPNGASAPSPAVYAFGAFSADREGGVLQPLAVVGERSAMFLGEELTEREGGRVNR